MTLSLSRRGASLAGDDDPLPLRRRTKCHSARGICVSTRTTSARVAMFNQAHNTSFHESRRLEPDLDELFTDSRWQQDTRLGDDTRDEVRRLWYNVSFIHHDVELYEYVL